MKTNFVITFLAAILVAAGAQAQTAAISAPSTPAPAIAAASPNAMPTASPAPAPNQTTIYAQRLPSATELTNAAAAQSLTVDRIEQTSSQVTVVYKFPNGQTSTVAYQLLPNAGTTPAPSAAPANAAVTGAPSSPAVVYTSPAPAVVYQQAAPRVIYYDTYDPMYYSYPRFWYPPVSLNLGFGFRSGGFRGGFHHWR